MKEEIIRILQKNSRLSNADIAAMTGMEEEDVKKEIPVIVREVFL